MDEFKPKNIFQRMLMSVPELEVYYRNLRKYQFDQRQPIKGIWWRKHIHGLFEWLLKIDRILSHEDVYVLNDEHTATANPVVYAATHTGGLDLGRIYEKVKPKAYILFGDPGEVYKSLYGLLAFCNGWIPFDTSDRLERKIATARAEELLKGGGNLLIFPEGAWNFSDHLPVMHIYNGAARIALHTGAEIIPIAVEVYRKTWYIRVGKNIDPTSLGVTDENTLTEYIRDQLATLKWEIWEQAPEAQQITGTEKTEWADQIRGLCVMGEDFSKGPAFVELTNYHDAADTIYKKPFVHLERIAPRLETAFLFNKRNHN